MSQQLKNPWRGTGLEGFDTFPLSDAQDVAHLLQRCPAHAQTPLRKDHDLAARLGVAELWIKDERARMGLGSFKALGAAYVIAREAAATQAPDLRNALQERVYITASAGNHGMSVAAGAQLFGARAVIVLSDTVPEAFAARLRTKGAEVMRAGDDYEASMQAAAKAAEANDWTLLSDSSWPGYTEIPLRVMEGYLQLAAEAVAQIEHPPTHILVQAGVGGLAAAVAAYARRVWGDGPQIIVVEPDAAPALIEAVRAGKLQDTHGPVSCMGRLDCKTASMIALAGLARDADMFVTISDADALGAVALLAEHGLPTTPSGAAGIAALLGGLDLPQDARILAILSEGPEDG
ncbi:pyridoxal-phosphate dependent enzyme [Roseinatronobacter sp.]|uniref:pyridoxal-phosphate dependent enzyme n=1 Tax=Roseinatronobacter sp. TaxID=1945755 RepID=UPI0025FEB209|nr:pyridoxal-phosphate dependent enzyme [Roseibaca sp.]